MEVYVVYKSYCGFEDNDSNGADIIGVYSSLDKAKKALVEAAEEDEEFFEENEVEFTTLQAGQDYRIDSSIGCVDFCITRLPVK